MLGFDDWPRLLPFCGLYVAGYFPNECKSGLHVGVLATSVFQDESV